MRAKKSEERTEIATGSMTSRLARTLIGARHQELEDTMGGVSGKEGESTCTVGEPYTDEIRNGAIATRGWHPGVPAGQPPRLHLRPQAGPGPGRLVPKTR